MGDLRNKAKKEADEQAIRDRERMRREGWTIFHFDFNPKLTRENLSPGDALRHLLKVTNHKIAWWRCPVRGWAIQYTKLPTTTKAYDHGETYRVMHFSRLEDELEAKKELCEDMLLFGIELYRGLPNKQFKEQVELIRWLLTAPPSVSAEDWLKRKEELPKRVQEVLRSHEAELRGHLLGQKYTGPSGPVELTVRARLEGRSKVHGTE
jgi:hypothetical protein